MSYFLKKQWYPKTSYIKASSLLTWPGATTLYSLWKISDTFAKNILAHLAMPSPKTKKPTQKKLFNFLEEKIICILGKRLTKNKASKTSYTLGCLLVKHKIIIKKYTLGWLLIKRRLKTLITWIDCWFSLPSELSKLKHKSKKYWLT